MEVKQEAALVDSEWTQREAKKLVWASGCVNWAVDEKTGLNNMMYPDWQFWFWFRSVFYKKNDFVYRDEKTGKEVKPVGSCIRTGVLIVGTGALMSAGLVLMDGVEVVQRLKAFDLKSFLNSFKNIRT